MNITLALIAEVIESVYYNGRPKSDKKLAREDFLQLARMNYGTVMRQLYYEAKNRGENPSESFGQLMEAVEFEVGKKDKMGRRIIEMEGDVMRLPKGLGIMQVSAAPGEESDVNFYRIINGSDWMYKGREYDEVPYFASRGDDKIILYNSPDCLKKVEVFALKTDEDAIVPEDAAFDIVNQVLGLSLKVAGFPVDTTNNMNPNLIAVKQKLAQTESI